MKSFLCLLLLFSCARFKEKNAEAPPPGSLAEAVESSFRSHEHRDRDRYQKPLETLTFFGVTPTQAVIEVAPGAGYFTEILAPYLAPEGQYYLAVPRMPRRPSPLLLENERRLEEILLRNPEVQRRSKFIPFEPIDNRNRTRPEIADLVLVFNSVHNWIAKNEVKEAFQFFREVLRPDGTLGIVQHRIAEGKPNVPKSGYLTEREVIRMAHDGGFELIERSELQANPRDTADYPEGVWVLPPTFRRGEEDRKRYERIGESDKMMLKFRKRR
jgi:predicted methyltransferase